MATQTLQDGWLPSAHQQPSPNFDERPAGCVPELLVIHAISLPVGQFSSALSSEQLPPSLRAAARREETEKLHPIALTPSYIDDLFLNRLDITAHPDFEQLKNLRVSAHFLIRRNGQLVQFVNTHQRAWHAGTSRFMERERCNDFSIGIELEGSDFVPFEPVQYTALVQLTHTLLQHYPIHHIVGHQDIAPERKTDPGPFFDWTHYAHLLTPYFPVRYVPDHQAGLFIVDK